ncbi:MAG: heavy-metal-associated domain-containing protein [Rhodospirillales bacterium]|nr:heavy-metal-associated domain-containing protein [Rhodospirillales bacterium]MCB9995200.1 heavy-metal-associated domain-containing protein [Rhodospirillales bacterium]
MKHLVLTALTLLTLAVTPAFAMHNGVPHDHDMDDSEQITAIAPEQNDVEVHVFGLVCDFCARAVEKVFMKREEVNGVNVDLDNFLVTIDLKDGADIDDETITELITDSGYTVNDITRPHG